MTMTLTRTLSSAVGTAVCIAVHIAIGRSPLFVTLACVLSGLVRALFFLFHAPAVEPALLQIEERFAVPFALQNALQSAASLSCKLFRIRRTGFFKVAEAPHSIEQPF